MIDRELAVIPTALTGAAVGLVGKFIQRHRAQAGGFAALVGFGVEGAAEGAHQPGDGRTDDVAADLFLEGAQDGVVVEGAALDDDLFAEVVGVVGADDLVEGVFHNADGKPGRDVLNAGALLLRLLDGRIHEDGAAAAEVDGMLGMEAELGKFCNVVAHGAGKRRDERAAAGGAGLVEEDRVDGAVFDLEALHVLPADVDDEVHIRLEKLGGGEMGDRFHEAVVQRKGCLNELLAVASDRRGTDAQLRIGFIEILQRLFNHCDRLAVGIFVAAVEELACFADEHELDAEVDVALIRGDVGILNGGFGVAGEKFLVLFFVCEEGLRRRGAFDGHGVFLEATHEVVQIKGHLVFAVEGCAHGNIIAGVFGEHIAIVGFKLEHIFEGRLQAGEEIEGPAEEDDLPLDLAALGQPADRLVGDGVENAHGDVFLLRALVEERLDVALGEDAAAAGDVVDGFRLVGEGVQRFQVDVQQHRHLIDEGAGAAGAGAVHAHL